MEQITLEANHCWIDTTPQNLAKNYGDFGIYILGIKNAQGRIIPYYVGQTGIGKSTSISKRVVNHICTVTSPYTTYTVFSEDFLQNKRGTSTDFIDRIKLPSKKYPALAFASDILYLNYGSFFNDSKILGPSIWPNLKKSGDLSELNKFPKTQILFNAAIKSQKTIFAPGRLYFTPITFGRESIEEIVGGVTTQFLNMMETYVKFSLKINTIGLSREFDSLPTYLKSHNVSIKIKCPGIQKEFHSNPQP